MNTEKTIDTKSGLNNKIRDLQMLLDLSNELAEKNNLDEVLSTLLDAIVKATGGKRGSLFLNDTQTNQLYSRIALGSVIQELRFHNSKGIAGAVFCSGRAEIINDPYSDKRFFRDLDAQTGYVTRSILAAPIQTAKKEIIGVAQVLNKAKGNFNQNDLVLLTKMTQQAAVILQGIQDVERIESRRREEMEFLDLIANVTSELNLNKILQNIMSEATRMLTAERSTLFLNDPKTQELFARTAQGSGIGEIRLPNHNGIAGAVFVSGESINIPYAYADLRFNPTFDKKTGFFTRTILCVPVINKTGDVIGVTQVLNKRGGPFTKDDEMRLKGFTAQVSIALENAKLFEDVQNMKNYNESMLQSMSNGVITLDTEGFVITCNTAGLSLLREREATFMGTNAKAYFAEKNAWLIEQIEKVKKTNKNVSLEDASLIVPTEEIGSEAEKLSVNIKIQPLEGSQNERLGTMLMIEDISSEKRVRATMSRYMDPNLAAQLLDSRNDDLLGGRSVETTILFSDIRSFTSISETLGAQETVAFLNEYFTLMVDCLNAEGGMLDKFIGDAIMAGFGVPIAHDDDPDRGMRTAISMNQALDEWNIQRTEKNKPVVKIGIGLNTGTVVTGNIGSPKRMDYTMIGDGVNLASRLESACKFYGTRILVSDFTVKKLRGTYRLREIDLVIVKGKTEPIAVHEVLDFYDDKSFPNMSDCLEYFRSGKNHYTDGNFSEAIKIFTLALKANPNDRVSELYVERCTDLLAKQPKDWNGVWVMGDVLVGV